MMITNICLCFIRCVLKFNGNKFRYLSNISSSSSIKLGLTMKKLISSQKYNEALDLFDRQIKLSTDITFTLALKACTKVYDYHRGIRIHKQLSSKSLEDPFIQTSLIHFYMQCHLIDNAYKIFSSIDKKTIFMYGAMFKGYMSNNMPEKVIELFKKMPIEFNEVIVIILFSACRNISNNDTIKLGKDLLNRLPISFLQHEKVITSAIDMLMKFGHVKDAENLFNKMNKKNLVSYGAMMQGYVTNNLYEKAVNLFEKISLKPNEVLYAIVYNACASLDNEKGIQLGKKIFHEMPKIYLNNIVVINSLIHMFMKYGQIKDSEYLFQQMNKPDFYTYGIMMNGYNINDEPHKCLSMFEEMKKKNMTINKSIGLSLIGACSQIGIRSISQNIVQQMSHLQHNLQLKTSLIDMWGKSGDINQAKEIFQSISQHDIISYNSMINAYARNGLGYQAIELYERIPENIRDRISHICVLSACSHSGLIDQARFIFNKIDIKTEEIIVTMVDCLSRLGIFDEAQKLIDDYEKSNSFSLVMYTAMLSGARNHRQAVLSQKLYDRMKYLFPDKKDDLISASILLSNTYLSLGDDQQAHQVRMNRREQFGKRVKVGLSWTEVNGELVKFKAHDRSHPRSTEIYAELDRLSNELKEYGHEYDSSWITRPLDDEETIESVLCGHSEKLAIAFNFIQQTKPSFIQITKNLRVCGDCHRATKIIAKIRQCQIIVRDANRIHHFHTNGQCSCQDYF